MREIKIDTRNLITAFGQPARTSCCWVGAGIVLDSQDARARTSHFGSGPCETNLTRFYANRNLSLIEDRLFE